MVRSGTTRKDSISSSTSPPGWESCRFRVAWGRDRASRGGPLLEAADLAVAEAVVDERHAPTRGRDARLVGAASLRDAMEVLPQRCAAVVSDDRFERCPTHELRTLFGDLAAHDFGV